MMVETVKVEGLDEIVARLRALPEAVSGKNGGPLRAALAAAARLVRDDARAHAPVATGMLRDNIIEYRDRNPERIGANEHYRVGVRKLVLKGRVKRLVRKIRKSASIKIAEDSYYWRFVEFGTAKMKARPFLRPAFDNNKSEINETMIQTLSKGIDAAVVKLGGKQT
jgi:HK97 gp10 family phage protein